MAKKPTVTTIASGYYSRNALNTNFEALRDGFDNTLSLDGSTPNAMGADLDMNSNDILNAQTINTTSLKINGTLVNAGDLSAAGATLSSVSYTGDGSTVAFSTVYEAFIADNTQVYIDGVYQNKSTYSISGTTLTFSEAPPLNSEIEIVVARTLDFGATDAANVGYTQGGTGSVNRTVQSRLRDFVSVKDFGAAGDGVTDDTAAIQAALDTTSNVYIPAGQYIVNGTLIIPAGGTLFGDASTGPYFRTQTMSTSTRLIKKAGGTSGPIVRMEWSTGLRGLVLDCEVASFGNDGIILLPGDEITTYCSISQVHVFGTRSQTVTGSDVCYGIKFEDNPTTSTVAFFNRVDNVTITDCDVAVYMGKLCNANSFTNIQTRECHIHYELDGGTGEVIENTFASLGLFSISGSLSPDPIGFKMVEARNNVFGPYATEMYGRAFDIDGATCSNNKFFGSSNEPVSSYAAGQTDLTYARPKNVDNFQALNHTTRTTGDRNAIGGGASWKRIFSIEGTLPEQNNNAGTITAGDADNKVIFRFPERFTKTRKPSFFVKLKVFAYGAFGNGMGMVEVDFGYSMRDQTSSAAELSVFNVNTMGNEITGLYFLTGVAAGDEMGVALVGGNYGSFAFTNIRCELEVCVFDFANNSAIFSEYTDLTSTTTADVTANDVTDAIDLLTVATTSV